jgi:hypothetical protein
MKALSVRQPYALLIASGDKPIEVRTWSTSYRGPLLICASAYKVRDEETGDYFPFGVTQAVVDLVDIRPLTKRDLKAAFMPNNFVIERELAWVLAHPRLVEWVPVKGRLHLFDVPDELITYLDDM